MRVPTVMKFAMLLALLVPFGVFAGLNERGFNDGWEFSHDRKSWRKVEIPHDWAVEEGFDAKLPHGSGALPWQGVGYYRKSLVCDKVPEGRVYLRFDGIMCDGVLYIDGQCAGHQPYGYLGLDADITPYIHAGTNGILVKADTTKLQSRWYPGAGIYRKVRLVTRQKGEAVPGSVVVRVGQITPDAAIMYASWEVVGGGRSEKTFTILKPHLWSVDDPYLYTFDAPGEQVRYGIRTAEWTADDGFLLNGRRLQLKGVNLHADLGILGMAFNKSAARRQLEIMRDMGANAIRTSHNPPAPEILDLCDEMGFVVWEEGFDKWTVTAGKGDEPLEPYIERGLVQMVRRDRNHPSVCVWSMGNEIPSAGTIAPGGTFWDSQASECTTRERCSLFRQAIRRVDPTRAVGIACCWTNAVECDDYEDLDLTGWNYAERYLPIRRKYPHKPIVYSESASAFSVYGYYSPERLATNRADYVGAPSMIDSYDRNSAVYSDIPDAEFERLERDRFVAGEFVWTGIDYLGEPSPYEKTARSSYFGICDLLGFPKDRYYLYRSYWRQDAHTLHVVPHQWNFTGVKTLPVYVYSDANEVELFLNGKSLGRRRKNPEASSRSDYYAVMSRYRFIWNDVAYAPGELKAVAYDASGCELGVEAIRTAGAAAEVVVEPEKSTLSESTDELVFCKVTLADAKGVPVPNDNRRVTFAAEGACEIVAVGNGDPTGLDGFKKVDSHPLHMGRCGFAVRRTRPGVAKVRVASDGLEFGEYAFAEPISPTPPDDAIALVAGGARMRLSGANGAIVSLKGEDGVELVERADELFVMQLLDGDGNERHLKSSDFAMEKSIGREETVLTFTRPDGPRVEMRIDCRNAGRFDFTPTVSQLPKGERLEWFDGPQPHVASKGGALYWPFYDGCEVADFTRRESGWNDYRPLGYTPRCKAWNALYPGPCQMQFEAYYRDGRGIYFGCHDPTHTQMGVEYDWQDERATRLSLQMFCGEMKDGVWSAPAPFTLRLYRGGWMEACEIYRDFVHTLPEFKSPVKRPKWMYDSPVNLIYPVQGEGIDHGPGPMSTNRYYPFINVMGEVEKYGKLFDSRIMALVMHWEGTAPWCPPYVWPPLGGEAGLAKLRDALHARGDLLGLYCSGSAWTQKSVINGYSQEKKCREEGLERWMMRGPKGQIEATICNHECAQRFGYDMCVAEEWPRRTLLDEVAKIARFGVDYCQFFDQNIGGAALLCYSREHHHPSIPGAWQTKAMLELQSAIRGRIAAVGSTMTIGCEACAATPFVKNLFYNDSRAENTVWDGTPVPGVPFVFHEWMGNFSGNQIGHDADVGYRWMAAFHRGESFSVVLGAEGELANAWGIPWSEPRPDQHRLVTLVRNLNAVRKANLPWLLEGKMLKPYAKVETRRVTVKFGDHEILADEVMSSFWEAPDGRRRAFLSNWGLAEAKATVILSDGRRKVYTLRPGEIVSF